MSSKLMENDSASFLNWKRGKNKKRKSFLTFSHYRSVFSPVLRPQRGSGQCRDLTLSLRCVRRPSRDAIPKGRVSREARRKGWKRWRRRGREAALRSEMCVKSPVATRQLTAFRLPAGSGAVYVTGGTRCVVIFLMLSGFPMSTRGRMAYFPPRRKHLNIKLAPAEVSQVFTFCTHVK